MNVRPKDFIFGGSLTLARVVARPTRSPSVLGHEGVLWRELMSGLAVRHRPSFCAAGFPAKREAEGVYAPIFIHQFAKIIGLLRSFYEGIWLKPITLSDLYNQIFDTLNRHFSGGFPISLLLLSAGPAAILGAVTLVVVDAVKRETKRPLSHIRKEIAKPDPVFRPPGANGYASPAISMPRRVAGVHAPTFHRFPHRVKRMLVLEWHRKPLIFRTVNYAE